MQSNEFPNCCGVVCLSRFGYDMSCDTTKSQCDDYLAKSEKENQDKRAMLLVALNDGEVEKLGSVFERRGWTRWAKSWSNPRTSHGITVYVWKCVGDQPKKKVTSSTLPRKSLVRSGLGLKRRRLSTW